MNKVILIGRLTADPELKQSQNGTSVCRFTVAVNRRFKNAQGGYDADFLNCTAWKQTAEFICKYFKKGQMIAVEGTLRTGSYQDRNHPDVIHYTTDISVENAEFCGGKSENTTPAQSIANKADSLGIPQEFEEIISDNEVPF